MSCAIDLKLLNPTDTCPADDEYLMFLNVAGSARGVGIRTWGQVKQCLINQVFGAGILVITGSQLDGANKYFNSDLIDILLVYASNIPNFLKRPSQWDYVLSGSEVVGVEIKTGYDPTDVFIIFPNPVNLNP